MSNKDRILILDFGSQVTQLIARRVREAGVYCEIMPFNKDVAEMKSFDAQGIILSGGPSSVIWSESPRAPQWVFDVGLPVLGICYGLQTMCQQLGGQVVPSDHQEFGRAEVDVVKDNPLFDGIWQTGNSYPVWMSHGDHADAMPEGFELIAKSVGAPIAAIADTSRNFYALQFHPEVAHTPDGARLLQNFVKNIAGCSGEWSMAKFRETTVQRIREQVGDGKVICGLSGGVDSSVTAVLIHEAIGENLTCIYVDHGLMRQNETEEVINLFRGRFNMVLRDIDASKLFMDRLKGVSDPEQKRKIIGATFIEVFEEEARKVAGSNGKGAKFLGQGTLYPDVIESVSFIGGPSVTIKSHHNVGGLPERMDMSLIEPLRELFKDEVRALGKEMGLAHDLVGRHPFPGPGLAIRIPGEITTAAADILRKADKIYIDEIKSAGLYDEIWQAFAVLLPVRTVGVMGDARTYEQVCALRAVTSTDGMTAAVYPFEPAFLERVATRIVNEVRGINRVVYDFTSKPPGTIEWE